MKTVQAYIQKVNYIFTYLAWLHE